MVYRESVDRLAVLRDALAVAQERELSALVAKQQSEIDVLKREAELEAAWANHGAQVAIERHYQAIAAAQRTARREISEATRAELARAEAERAAFLRARGVEPGPAPSDVESVEPDEFEPAISDARRKAAELRSSIERIERELATARERFAQAAEELMHASRAVRAATKELSAVGGLSSE